MEVDSSSAIPVQAILKLIVDRSGSEEVEQVLKKQDEAFSKVEQTVKRVGAGVEGIGNLGGDYDAAGRMWDEAVAGDYLGDLGAGVGGGDDGAAAGEHAGEFGRHDEVGCSGALG